MKAIIEVNQANFQNEVLNSTRPVLVDFRAEWCSPCKMIDPMLEEIATEHTGLVKFASVNVDENPALSGQYHITAIPTLLFFINGLVYGQIVGVAGKKAIVSKLEEMTVLA
jgi:thioredoxin 1